jgi:hypothetical protein
VAIILWISLWISGGCARIAALTLIASLLFTSAFALIVYSVIETLNDASDSFAAIEHNLYMLSRQRRTIRLGEPRYQGARHVADILQLPLRLEMPHRMSIANDDKLAA